jgi:hypothetical protein
MSASSVSRTFSDFYYDDTLFGHFLLRPSILMGEIVKTIGSDLRCRGCCGVVQEIFVRIILSLIVVLMSPCLVLVPIGLTFKWFASCCAPDAMEEPPSENATTTKKMQKVVVPPKGQNTKTPSAASAQTNTPPASTKAPKPKEASAKTPKTPKPVPQPKPAAQPANIPQVSPATPPHSQGIPDKKNTTQASPATKSGATRRREKKPHTSERKLAYLIHGKQYTTHNVPESGNCLFDAFAVHAALNKGNRGKKYQFLDTFTDGVTERGSTIDWIEANYSKSEELQASLTNSIAEHFAAKIAMLTAKNQNLQTLIDENPLPDDISDDEPDNNALQEVILSEALEEYHSNMRIVQQVKQATDVQGHHLNLESLKNCIKPYCKDMRDPHIFAGHAEFFALCCRFEVCAEVYTLHSKTGKVLTQPIKINNRGDPSMPVLYFLYDTNRSHYSPLVEWHDYLKHIRKIPVYTKPRN